MIDIHCHALYGVDDGAANIEESAAMLKQAASQGVEAVVLTPHYRHGMFPYPKERIWEHFEKLKPTAEEIGMELYLGCEYHVNSRIVEALTSGRCLSLAEGDFVLTEYSFDTEYSYINEQTRKLLSCGYIPVVAHVERYGCFLKNPKLCAELADTGAYIQVNADSILGLTGRTAERFCKKLLKHEWVDIVASDAHGIKNRASHLGECQEYIIKKYGKDYAELLLEHNPQRIICGR
ncbi:MAG: PHP domain-containing protein [Lachnospiraceae bacterium]